MGRIWNRFRRGATSDTTPEPRGLWGLSASLAIASLVAQAVGATETLRFDRSLIEAGEAWRLFTAHLVHLGWAHWALNLAGLALVALCFDAAGRPREWVGAMACAALFASLGVYAFDPEIETFSGLSAVLHGLFLYGAAREISRDRVGGIALVLLLVAKLAWEQFRGPMPGSETIVGGHVLTSAHLYGSVGGGFALAVVSAPTMLRVLRGRRTR